MRTPLAGKRAFEAMGRRASSLGIPLNAKRLERRGLPAWAQSAYARGWIQQPSQKELSTRIVDGFAGRAIRDGISLMAAVDRFLDEKCDASKRSGNAE